MRVFFAFFFIALQTAFGQDSASKSKEIDIIDVFRQVFKIKIEEDNPIVDSLGQKFRFNLLPGVGYTLTTHYEASLSFNASFKRPYANYSSVLFIPTITSRRQYIFPLTINYWTKNNQYNLVCEMHAFKYPQSTFGLGTKTLPTDEMLQHYKYLRIHDFLFRKIKNTIYAGVGIHLDHHWHITQNEEATQKLNQNYSLGITKRSYTAGYSVNFLFDNRKNSINPEKGTYLHLHYRRNLKTLRSNYHSEVFVTNFKYYTNFPKNSKNILAFWNYNTFLLNGKLPYLDLPSTAWDFNDRTGRGYIQGRFRGKDWIYAETEYRFGITQNGLLGGVVFVNSQSFTEPVFNKFEKFVFGKGIGLRIKLNKTSRTNIAIDYAFGNHGSKGFFIDIGEIF